ncbi:MAG TPA: hypothetical protein VGM51_12115 [Armatimonadota bacterium]|jgi:hypothetical protein
MPGARAAQANSVVLSPGTVIPVKLITQLSSDKSHKGDSFTASVDDSKATYRAIMHGGTVSGVVRQATPKSGKIPGLLDLSFTRLQLADGRSFAISGVPTSMDAKYITTNSRGVMVARNSVKNQRLKYAGIGAGTVALVKVLGGNKVKIADILLGGGLGYAAGSILKGPSQVNDVTLKPGTQIGVLLGNGVRYSKVASRPAGRGR